MKKYVATLTEALCESLIAEIKTREVDPSHGHMELEESNPFYN